MADTDRVRMKAKSTFNNPLITVADRPVKKGEVPRLKNDAQTVDEGDEFSTHEEHAKELEALGYAERTDGKAEDETEAAAKLRGSQTSAGGAIASNRKASEKAIA